MHWCLRTAEQHAPVKILESELQFLVVASRMAIEGFRRRWAGFPAYPQRGLVVSRVALSARLVFSAVVVVAGLLVLVVAQLAVAERPARPDPTAPGFQRESREAESIREEQAQRRRSPGGREERRRARVAFRGLDGPGARVLARRVFPGGVGFAVARHADVRGRGTDRALYR